MKLDTKTMVWTRRPAVCSVTEDQVSITTEAHTDLWQRTYYHFRNDNAPLLQMQSLEQYFSFTVHTVFDSKVRFDQSGIVMYLDSKNWLKASIEYENEQIQRLGSVVTNDGYSDWASVDIDASVRSAWFRLSRRADDFCIEYSRDGQVFKQMRICHMNHGQGEVSFGVYACSPEASSFTATFDHMQLTECLWKAHDGQAPDSDL